MAEEKKTEPQETPDPLEEPTREQRIEKLEERIAELTDGKMTFFKGGEDTDADQGVIEAFLENVVAMEKAGWSTAAERLEEGGLELVPADELDDEALTKKLWDVVHAMALRNMYVTSTNHLSDRELYVQLIDSLYEESFMGPATRGFNFVIDLVSSGSDESIDLSFKYYAGEDQRQHWMDRFPDYEMPAKETPPYDRSLPQPDWTPPDDDDEEAPM